jgi:hypothetical protein
MKKGKLRDTMEKARFAPSGKDYSVQFRDKRRLAEVSIEDFWEIADIIPEHRIARVLKDGVPIYRSSKSELLSLPVQRVTDVSVFRREESSRREGEDSE